MAAYSLPSHTDTGKAWAGIFPHVAGYKDSNCTLVLLEEAQTQSEKQTYELKIYIHTDIWTHIKISKTMDN